MRKRCLEIVRCHIDKMIKVGPFIFMSSVARASRTRACSSVLNTAPISPSLEWWIGSSRSPLPRHIAETFMLFMSTGVTTDQRLSACRIVTALNTGIVVVRFWHGGDFNRYNRCTFYRTNQRLRCSGKLTNIVFSDVRHRLGDLPCLALVRS